MDKKHSVPVSLIRSYLVAIERHRFEVNGLLIEAGLKDVVEKISSTKGEERVSLEDLGAVLRTIWIGLGDEASGFLTRPMKVGSFGMMCHALITSGNLRRALLRSSRFISLITDDLYFELVESGTEAKLLVHYDNPHGLDEAFFITSLFVIWIRLSCWMLDQAMLLERIQFRFDEPDFVEEFSLMFPCRISFNQNENSVVFSRRLLALPIKQTPQTLVPFLSHAPESLLTQFRTDESMTAQVKRLLLKSNDLESEMENLTFEQIADSLSSTTHTLRRRLKEEGNSFQEIKDSLRRDKALTLLQDSNLGIHEIALLLGFSEPAAFNRAFKKWMGSSPGQYRKVNSPSGS